jgi:voltage-gated potassium channel Kch
MSSRRVLEKVSPKSRSIYLLLSLILVIFGHPIIAGRPFGDFVFGILIATTPFAGVYAVSGKRRLQIAAVILGIPALVGVFEHFFLGVTLGDERYFVAMIFVYYAFTTAAVIFHLFRKERVDVDTVISAVSAYLMIGLTFATLHVMISLTNPESYTGEFVKGVSVWSDSLYYSFVTLTTLGYGDIAPLTPIARSMSTLEATTGVLYMGILIARLVSDYQSSNRSGDAD